MFVVTADQRASRTGPDLVPEALRAVQRLGADRLSLPPERNAGDEIQALTADAGAALDIVLHLIRTEQWSVGLGVGAVELPLPSETRAARGPAFIHAREAVERAKRAPSGFALETDDRLAGQDVEALISLLNEVRERRTPQGWEVADLLAEGKTQQEAATVLGISPAAVSMRAKSAALRMEEAAIPALTRVLQRLDDEAASVERA